MTGPENEKAAGDGRLRASHTDREHVIDTLKAAYVYGYVTKDEFDARVSQTLASRTYAELACLTADIPAGLATAPSGPAPVTGNAPEDADVRPGDRAIVMATISAFTALMAVIFAVSPVAGLAVTGSAFVALSLAAARTVDSTARHALRRSAANAAGRTAGSGLTLVSPHASNCRLLRSWSQAPHRDSTHRVRL
jgi:Domain of unknown function (DUF1707)